MRARLRIEGLKEARARVDELGIRAQRPEPVLRSDSVKLDLLESEGRRFARTTGWRKDNPKWLREKQRRGLDPRVMRATGHLERALTTGADAAITFQAYNSELRWGIRGGRTDLYYAAPLARGTTRHPRRRMVVIDQIARAHIAGRIEHYIANGIIT